jgi:hypothetical protein
MSTVTCSICAYCGHPSGRRAVTADPVGRRAGTDTPAGGGQADTPAGATLQGVIHACAMGEGSYGGSPIGDGRQGRRISRITYYYTSDLEPRSTPSYYTHISMTTPIVPALKNYCI